VCERKFDNAYFKRAYSRPSPEGKGVNDNFSVRRASMAFRMFTLEFRTYDVLGLLRSLHDCSDALWHDVMPPTRHKCPSSSPSIREIDELLGD
jgi:hypothetical protein